MSFGKAGRVPRKCSFRAWFRLLPLLIAIGADGAWYSPDYLKLQYAGSIGFISPGIGYGLLNDRASIELFGGYVPESFGGTPISSMTLKADVHLVKIRIGKSVSFDPLILGVLANHTFGDEFYLTLPNNYPDDYFWWSTALRFGLFTGGSLEKRVVSSDGSFLKSVGVYFEVNTNELYLMSFYENMNYLEITDILSLGLGIKLSFD